MADLAIGLATASRPSDARTFHWQALFAARPRPA
jgi:hypothetical protein